MIPRALMLLVAALLSSAADSQTDTARWTWFPRTLLFAPPLGSHEEPIMGVEQQLGSTRLRVGIGNATDLVQYGVGNDTVRVGADFFAFALAGTIRDVRLKIDAADGFFGMHFAWTNGSAWSLRFRAIHQSSHLVDGHYNIATQTWDDNRQPIPFSRNYDDLLIAYTIRHDAIAMRFHAGPSFAVYNNPKDIRRWGATLGGEVHSQGSVAPYAAYEFSLLGVPTYTGSSALEAGVKFGEWTGRGIRLYLVYDNGLNPFGEYYKEREEFLGAGFAIDFW